VYRRNDGTLTYNRPDGSHSKQKLATFKPFKMIKKYWVVWIRVIKPSIRSCSLLSKDKWSSRCRKSIKYFALPLSLEVFVCFNKDLDSLLNLNNLTLILRKYKWSGNLVVDLTENEIDGRPKIKFKRIWNWMGFLNNKSYYVARLYIW
jgi:hypothetical protein